MKFENYIQQFHEILNGNFEEEIYHNPAYLEYVKLNNSRQNRWLKKGELLDSVIQTVAKIEQPQNWTIITEPWCGDAAHNIPFIHRLSTFNKNIKLDYVLRDQPPFLIDQYLTNGGKSIPKLIVQDADGNDLFTWGPRPKAAQELMINLKDIGAPGNDIKIALQQWYNKDKGVSVQKELGVLIKDAICVDC